jgi:Tfp pilus assembly protein PilN
MKNNRPLRINLASEPLQNKRLFQAGLALMLVFITVIGVAAGWSFIRFLVQNHRLGAEAARLTRSLETARSEASRFRTRAQDLTKKEKSEVDFLNDLIHRKSFSWVGLLSRLEEALPASGSVTSLSPAFSGGSKAEVTLTAVFQNLNDLLAFIQNLQARGFSRIRLVSEGKNGYGQLESEIAVIYEGTR